MSVNKTKLEAGNICWTTRDFHLQKFRIVLHVHAIKNTFLDFNKRNVPIVMQKSDTKREKVLFMVIHEKNNSKNMDDDIKRRQQESHS